MELKFDINTIKKINSILGIEEKEEKKEKIEDKKDNSYDAWFKRHSVKDAEKDNKKYEKIEEEIKEDKQNGLEGERQKTDYRGWFERNSENSNGSGELNKEVEEKVEGEEIKEVIKEVKKEEDKRETNVIIKKEDESNKNKEEKIEEDKKVEITEVIKGDDTEEKEEEKKEKEKKKEEENKKKQELVKEDNDFTLFGPNSNDDVNKLVDLNGNNDINNIKDNNNFNLFGSNNANNDIISIFENNNIKNNGNFNENNDISNENNGNFNENKDKNNLKEEQEGKKVKEEITEVITKVITEDNTEEKSEDNTENDKKEEKNEENKVIEIKEENKRKNKKETIFSLGKIYSQPTMTIYINGKQGARIETFGRLGTLEFDVNLEKNLTFGDSSKQEQQIKISFDQDVFEKNKLEIKPVIAKMIRKKNINVNNLLSDATGSEISKAANGIESESKKQVFDMFLNTVTLVSLFNQNSPTFKINGINNLEFHPSDEFRKDPLFASIVRQLSQSTSMSKQLSQLLMLTGNNIKGEKEEKIVINKVIDEKDENEEEITEVITKEITEENKEVKEEEKEKKIEKEVEEVKDSTEKQKGEEITEVIKEGKKEKDKKVEITEEIKEVKKEKEEEKEVKEEEKVNDGKDETNLNKNENSAQKNLNEETVKAILDCLYGGEAKIGDIDLITCIGNKLSENNNLSEQLAKIMDSAGNVLPQILYYEDLDDLNESLPEAMRFLEKDEKVVVVRKVKDKGSVIREIFKTIQDNDLKKILKAAKLLLTIKAGIGASKIHWEKV